MELWIRSQDRKILKKIDSLYVATYSEDAGYGIYDISSDDIDDCDIPLGFYKTKERALEVLDDIEDKLINCTFAKKQNGLGEVLDFMPNSIYVYTMPKE